MDDFEYQLNYVADASWRVLEMQDRNPLSPSHGCFHYSFWRDKTSEFSDARFQEAGVTLGLLSLPRFDHARAAGRLASADELYDGFSAALRFWSASQYPEGCWDEWYKGERGFAATEFTMIAYGLAYRYLGSRLRDADQQLLLDTLRKAADWLGPRHDHIKSNHEAAAGAALALAWEATRDERYKTAARDKIEDTLKRQTSEGWFPEIGGMDLGYCSVLLDYVMIYVLVTGDRGPVSAMQRLLSFMFPHVHPDGTISPEAGLCLNPYVSRLGIGLLSSLGDSTAAAITTAFEHASPGRKGLAPYLADDLRLCRWSHLPIVTILERERFGRLDDADVRGLSSRFPRGWTLRTQSAIAAYHDDTMHVYFSIAGGGAVRVYSDRELVYEDLGIDVVAPDAVRGSAGYLLARPVERIAGGIRFMTGMGTADFFYPGFLSRLVLRIGSTTPQLSRLLRRLIDWYRVRKGTAINQSAAPVAHAASTIQLERSITIDGDQVVVHDFLQRKEGQIDSRWLRFKLQVGQTRPATLEATVHARSLAITKRVKLGSKTPEFSMSLSHT
jgi:hypothetical protein